MNPERLRLVICGLSLTSSWGNGHATTYRSLVRALKSRGHDVLFLECDRPWYAERRDLPEPDFCEIALYQTLDELKEKWGREIETADAVIVGSYVQDGIALGEYVTSTARGITAFYDIDTPVTLARLGQPGNAYLSRELIAKYDLYLSFTGGPTLPRLEKELGSPLARALYCSVDETEYFPEDDDARWDLGYLGTYSADRQPTLQTLMFQTAEAWAEGRFMVAGAMYPNDLTWPKNVEHVEHLPPHEHRAFYNQQRFTLNVTRQDMVSAGYSPSVRLFEAAACGTPIVSDYWSGLETLFEPGREIVVVNHPREVLAVLRDMPEDERQQLGARARARVLREHTAIHRAEQLEGFLREARRAKVRRTITSMEPWFHNIHLPDEVQTAPDHFLGDFPMRKWREIESAIPADMTGWSVLDIGCNAGFYSFEFAKRGARVLGIDVEPHYLAQARWLAETYHPHNKPTFREMQIHDLARLDETFDLVFFMGVFYHLRYPQLALDTVAAKTKRMMIFQTLTMAGDDVERPREDYDIDERQVFDSPGWPKMAFIEKNFSHDPTNWWAPNHAAVEAMLRSTGFASVERIAHEIYVCQSPKDGVFARRQWDATEWESATGVHVPKPASLSLAMDKGGYP